MLAIPPLQYRRQRSPPWIRLLAAAVAFLLVLVHSTHRTETTAVFLAKGLHRLFGDGILAQGLTEVYDMATVNAQAIIGILRQGYTLAGIDVHRGEIFFLDGDGRAPLKWVQAPAAGEGYRNIQLTSNQDSLMGAHQTHLAVRTIHDSL